MNIIRFELNHGSYTPKNDSNLEMCILGHFLTSDVGWRRASFFKQWALADKKDPKSEFNYSIGGNATYLEEDDNGDVHLIDDTGSDEDDIYYVPAHFKMTKQQFVQLLDDWQEKVCKYKPREVLITEENGKFTIEIKS
jgi:hypothetical protein